MSKLVLLRLSEDYLTLLDGWVLPSVIAINWKASRPPTVPRRKVVYAKGYVNGLIGAVHCRGTMGLHRFLLCISNPSLLESRAETWCADHKNGDGLDNRLENLRAIPSRENARNRHSDDAPLASGIIPLEARIVERESRGQWASPAAMVRRYALLPDYAVRP